MPRPSLPAESTPRVLPHLVSLMWFGFVALAVVYGLAGRTMLEKTLTSLATPVGLVWLVLIAIGWWLIRSKRRGTAAVIFATWLLLTLSGNAWVTNQLLGQLEAPWQQVDGISGPAFDVVVVLGGGTSERGAGRAQLAADGERVITAARMFHAGKTKQILCTGTQLWRASEQDLHFREEAAQILEGLAIPADRIGQLEGPNTTVEMQNLQAWINRQPDPTLRVGIITSAYHLSRAMRLAAVNGIAAEPIPANFFSQKSVAATPAWIVPDADNLLHTAAALKEHLAGLIGR